MSEEVAFNYMKDCMRIGLRMRVCDARVDTFLTRLDALSVLTNYFREYPESLEDWRPPPYVTLRAITWSDKQQEFLDYVADRINIRDSNDMAWHWPEN